MCAPGLSRCGAGTSVPEIRSANMPLNQTVRTLIVASAVLGIAASLSAQVTRVPVAAVTPIASHAVTPASPLSFRNHVIPVLTKMGCNSGACHGAAAGKNGFSLTLRGYDPAADYDAIARHAAGRRINRLEPAKSLLLLKPTEVVPHMGGKRFAPDSAAYS